MNYSRARNPERLLHLLGFADVDALHTPEGVALPDSAREALFMQRMHTLSADDLRPLVVLIGGFLDGSRANAYSIRRQYPPELLARHDFFYREHPEGASARELVELYRHRGHPVMLIGHSWGADACVYGVALKTAARIDLLATLDPVSRKRVPQTCPVHIRHWLNIHLDYHRATHFNRSNTTARCGGPWEAVPAAHKNITVPVTVPHDDAATMFRDYVLDKLYAF